MDVDRIREEIGRSLDKNYFTFRYLDDQEQDMKDYLDITNSLSYINCSNMDVTISSKINKITLKGCENMHFSLKGLVNGIEVNNCDFISFICDEDVNSLYVDKCFDVSISIKKKYYKKTVFEVNRSADVSVLDKKGKPLKLKIKKK